VFAYAGLSQNLKDLKLKPKGPKGKDPFFEVFLHDFKKVRGTFEE